jgi:perosamine synthetase
MIGNTDYLSSFSFSMPKIITTGQGGCLTTNSDELAHKIKKLKDFGRIKACIDLHDEFGINSKFTDLQALVGLEQMKTINERVKRKKEIYQLYYNELKNNKNIEMLRPENHITPWFVDIYIENRYDLISYLKFENIESRIVYPAIYTQKSYNLNYSYVNAENYTSKGLWLPSSLTLTNEDIKYICKKINEFYEEKK